MFNVEYYLKVFLEYKRTTGRSSNANDWPVCYLYYQKKIKKT